MGGKNGCLEGGRGRGGGLEATTSDIIICDYLVSEGKVREF